MTLIGDTGAALGQFSQPNDIAVDAQGNLFVVDTQNHRVQKIALDGEITTFGETGSGDGQFGDPYSDTYKTHEGPWGIAVDSAGNIYVADTWNSRIQKFAPDFTFITEWGDLFGPRDVAIDAQGNVWVVDTGNKRIRQYTADGELIKDYGTTKKDSMAYGSAAATHPTVRNSRRNRRGLTWHLPGNRRSSGARPPAARGRLRGEPGRPPPRARTR